MRRDTRCLARTILGSLLFAGCADSDGQAGPSATESNESSTMNDGAMSTAGSAPTMGAAPDTGSGATSTGGTTSGASASTGADTTPPTTSDGGSSESSGGETGETGETGEIDGTETTGGTTGGTTGEDTAGAPSFAVDIYPIFDDNCSCHQDKNGTGHLRLGMDDSYMNLVGVDSYQLPKMKLVEPGAPDMSYLWHKLNNTQKDVGGKGKKMPPGGLLKKDELALIQMWIEAGAKP